MIRYDTGPKQYFKNLWERYKRYAETHTEGNKQLDVKDVVYWRDRLFTTFSIYFIPISFLALIPGVWMSVRSGLYFVGAFDILAAASITLVIFNRNLSLIFRKAFVVTVIYLLAILLTLALGLFGPGIIYLLALTVIVTLFFPVKWAYGLVALHFLTCVCFTLLIVFNAFNTPLAGQNSMGPWIAFSSNLIFLSLVSIILIDNIINGLEETIKNEYALKSSLQAGASEKTFLNRQLSESEEHYKSLFFLNPSPMWVLDAETFRFLQVNEAAIVNYGYTSAEFLSLTIRDIKCDTSEADLVNIINDIIAKDEPSQFNTSHFRKGQHQFPVEMRYSPITFKGRKALLGIARDITEQVEHINAIENQNVKLRNIAFIQSHIVRAPLARLMGLVNLMGMETEEDTKLEILNYMGKSATELDEVIMTIIDNTREFENNEPIIKADQ